jgi:hypothetical protein
MQKNEDLSRASVITRVNSSQNNLLTCINNIFTYVKSLNLCFGSAFISYCTFASSLLVLVRYLNLRIRYEANVSEIVFTLSPKEKPPVLGCVSNV